MVRRQVAQFLVAVVLAGATGCRNDGGYSTSSGGGGTPSPGGTPNTVTISGMAFSPSTLTVADSAVVTFTNNDPVTHTATADDASWDTGGISPHTSKTIRFVRTGTFTYHCVIHPTMIASIRVQ
jgi:plastocyanin